MDRIGTHQYSPIPSSTRKLCQPTRCFHCSYLRGAPWPYLCSGTWDELCRPLTMIGRSWNGTYRGRREKGDGWRRSWEGRGRIREWQGGYMWGWCKQCSYLGPICGYWPPCRRRPLRGFTTGQNGGCQAWYPNIIRKGRGCIHPLGRRCKWWDWRRSGYISPAARTRSHNILQLVLSWNFFWWRIGIWECAYSGDGGSSPPCISWE